MYSNNVCVCVCVGCGSLAEECASIDRAGVDVNSQILGRRSLKNQRNHESGRSGARPFDTGRGMCLPYWGCAAGTPINLFGWLMNKLIFTFRRFIFSS